MGHQLKIESDEAVALASELAHLMGKDLDAAVIVALRDTVERERKRHMRLQAINEAIAAVRASLKHPIVPYSDDELYDPDTGLPR